MRRIPVPDSTSIASAGYDPTNRELEIEFRDSGDIYRYFEVPYAEYAPLLDAASRGAWFNRFFKPKDTTISSFVTATGNRNGEVAGTAASPVDRRAVSI